VPSPQQAGGTGSPLPRLHLLGRFWVERDGQVLPETVWQRSSGKALVKLLAVERTHRLHREQVMERLWPDLELAAAENAFRKALHHARHGLEPELPAKAASSYLHQSNSVVTLDAERIWVDADQFQVLAERALAGEDESALEAALAMYAGELLPEDRYQEWTLARRETLADLHQALLLRLAGACTRRGDHLRAISSAREVVASDPACEEAHRLLMRLYAASGRPHQARRQYRACSDALRQVLGTQPGSETTTLYQRLLAGGDQQSGDAALHPDGPQSQASSEPALPTAIRRPPAIPLIGREAVLAQLLDALARARRGQGALILVGGEAGVGKSRLLSEVARTAAGRGALVLWGACYEQEGQAPYGPFVEALDGYVASRSAADRADMALAHAELVPLLPALSAVAKATAPRQGSEVERSRLFAAVVRFLGTLGAERPVVLVLDDLHIADAASLQLLHHVARVAADRTWLIVGAYREEDLRAGGDLQRLWTAATRQGICRRMDLPPLGRPDCDRLVETLLPDSKVERGLLDRLAALSLGNALFLQELVRALLERGNLGVVEGRWCAIGDVDLLDAPGGLPAQIRDLIEARIHRLPEDVRATLSLAATAGMESSFALLHAAGELADGPLLDALDRALEARIFEERGEGYVFRHPLLRAALYERLSRHRRARLHAALATALERLAGATVNARSDVVEALAHHWAGAGEPARAAPYLIEAGERAARVYANAEAIARFQRALALQAQSGLIGPDDAARRAFALERLGDLYALSGQSEAARESYAAALGDEGGRMAELGALDAARLHRKAAHQALLAGEVARAADLLRRAGVLLEQVAPGSDRDLESTRLLSVEAQERWLAYRFEEALAAAEASAHLAEAIGAEAERAQAYEMMALACLPLGDWQRGVECERRRASLVDLNREVAEVADVHL